MDLFKEEIGRLLEKDPEVSVVVICPAARDASGYDGGLTILRNYLREVRPPRLCPVRAYVRVESAPGELLRSVPQFVIAI